LSQKSVRKLLPAVLKNDSEFFTVFNLINTLIEQEAHSELLPVDINKKPGALIPGFFIY